MKFSLQPAVVHHGLVESDEGPEAGHLYRLTVTSSSAPGEAEDAYFSDDGGWGQLRTVEVRAHGLRAALLKAAELPVQTWFEADGNAPILPADQLR